MSKVLAIIPARSGSKGIPGKNIRPFCGLPLIAHSIIYGQSCKSIDRLIVSTDSQEIADVARHCNAAEVQMRPAQLARDSTPVWDVIKDVLARAEQAHFGLYTHVVLLEPTSPTRVANGVNDGLAIMKNRSDADGVIAVSKHSYNPIWNGFTREDPYGFLDYLIPDGANKYQRQQVPDVWFHSGDYYIWRTEFIRKNPKGYQGGKFIGYETPVTQAFSFDTLEELEWAEKLVHAGLIKLSWQEKVWDVSKAVPL